MGYQASVIQAAILELDETFTGALDQPSDVECPMCGHHYHNRIADQFELVSDKDDLAQALLTARRKISALEEKIAGETRKLDGVAAAIDRVQQILAIHKEDITLGDVVAAEGRSEAQRVLHERLTALDAEYGDKQRRLADAEERMKQSDSKAHKQVIKHQFSGHLTEFSKDLDVRFPDKAGSSLQGVNIGRGSEGPRGLAAYYYAFLHTAHHHGSSAFCPIVIDAPIQQGQDQIHFAQVMEFLLEKMPVPSQVVIAIETTDARPNVRKIDVSYKKHQVLREDQFETVRDYMRPFLQQNIF